MPAANTPVKEVNERNEYLRLGGIFAAVMLALFVIGGFATYPTQAHRDVSTKSAKIVTDGIAKGSDMSAIVNSDEFKSTTQSNEYRYSSDVSTAFTLLQWAVTVGIVAYIYVYLRRHEVGENYVKSAALLGAVVGMVVSVVSALIGKYVGYPDVSPSPFVGMQIIVIAFIAVVAFLISWLISYITARIAKWWMDRKLPESQRD